MTSLSNQKTIYLVKVGETIIEKTFLIEEAREVVNDYNFDRLANDFVEKAKLFKATIHTYPKAI